MDYGTIVTEMKSLVTEMNFIAGEKNLYWISECAGYYPEIVIGNKKRLGINGLIKAINVIIDKEEYVVIRFEDHYIKNNNGNRWPQCQYLRLYSSEDDIKYTTSTWTFDTKNIAKKLHKKMQIFYNKIIKRNLEIDEIKMFENQQRQEIVSIIGDLLVNPDKYYNYRYFLFKNKCTGNANFKDGKWTFRISNIPEIMVCLENLKQYIDKLKIILSSTKFSFNMDIHGNTVSIYNIMNRSEYVSESVLREYIKILDKYLT